jgi:hypothetical protein
MIAMVQEQFDAFIAKIGPFTKEYPQVAAVTAVAFAALGIMTGTHTASIIISTSFSLILSLTATLTFLGLSASIAYSMLKQSPTSFTNAIGGLLGIQINNVTPSAQ